MQVPFLNLRLHHEPIRADLRSAIDEVIEASAFAGGRFVELFEDDFARSCGARYVSGLGSGTDALWFALLAVGVGPGDEVITVPSTFMATAEAISFCGAKPVLVDIEPRTCTLDPNQLEAAITPRTKAIVPVHLFGQMADMDPITAIAKKHGLAVIEDACQAHAAEYKGRKAGTIGDIGCFSFYPGKNLGALGEAGAAITSNLRYKQTIDTLRDHGQVKKYHHSMIGWNGRMDGIQAAVLRVKLKHLPAYTATRQKKAKEYRELLAEYSELQLPFEAPGRAHVYHLYAVRTKLRDQLFATLARDGVQCGIHYPVPIHLQPAYKGLGYRRGSFPVAEQCADEFLSLPIYAELTSEQIHYVSERVEAFFEKAVAVA
jgi:dTDP-4-amino-4,6-dideoxygalactose transaminase